MVTVTGASTAFANPVAAQTDIGTQLCGTPIADFINGVVPLVVSLAMIAGFIIALYSHIRKAATKNGDEARIYIDWRNRAGFAAVTAPLFAFLLDLLIGFMGIGIAPCINLVPFF